MTDKKIRVLLAEGGSGEAARCLRGLSLASGSELELTAVASLSTLFPTIDVAAPEAILLDLALTHPEPLDVVRRVHRAAPSIPLIVLANLADRGYAARSLTEGAIDYLVKGYMDARTVERVLRGALERNTIEGLADLLRDRLTGLYNLDGFRVLGARAMEAAQRTGGTLVLLCAWLENFTTLRAEHGLIAAERAVRELAELLSNCFRRSDLLARLREAELAALAVDAAEPSASVLRQRVVSRLGVHNQSRDLPFALSLQLSVAFWGGNDQRSFAELLEATEFELRQSSPGPTTDVNKREPSGTEVPR